MTVIAMLGGDPEGVADQMHTAAALAKRLGAPIKGLAVLPDPAATVVYAPAYAPGTSAMVMGAKAAEAIAEAQVETRAKLKAAFDAAAKKAGPWLRTDYEDVTGSIAYRAAGAAMLSAALVLPHGAVQSAHPLNLGFEHALMEARQPLVLASAQPHEDKTCIIAWDGSTQAARSVRAHLPLIQTYSHVIIAQDPEKLQSVNLSMGETDPQILADFLQAFQLETEIVQIQAPTSEALLKLSQERGAGLLVMGAYGHNRLGEMVFGGTSRSLLGAEDAPALALMH